VLGFYRYIGGIKPNALEEIEISPAPVGPNSPVNRASVSYNSIKGLISVNWKKNFKLIWHGCGCPFDHHCSGHYPSS